MLGFGPAWSVIDAGGLSKFPVLPGIERLTVTVDNDVSGAGQSAAAETKARWEAAGLRVRTIMSLTPGNDLNDVLRVRKGPMSVDPDFIIIDETGPAAQGRARSLRRRCQRGAAPTPREIRANARWRGTRASSAIHWTSRLTAPSGSPPASASPEQIRQDRPVHHRSQAPEAAAPRPDPRANAPACGRGPRQDAEWASRRRSGRAVTERTPHQRADVPQSRGGRGGDQDRREVEKTVCKARKPAARSTMTTAPTRSRRRRPARPMWCLPRTRSCSRCQGAGQGFRPGRRRRGVLAGRHHRNRASPSPAWRTN